MIAIWFINLTPQTAIQIPNWQESLVIGFLCLGIGKNESTQHVIYKWKEECPDLELIMASAWENNHPEEKASHLQSEGFYPKSQHGEIVWNSGGNPICEF